MRKIALFILLGFSLTACDNRFFTQLFRNPYIVDIASAKMIKAGKWYDFETSVKAVNNEQNIYISFKGSEPDKLEFNIVDPGSENEKSVFLSSDFPGNKIEFDVKALNSKGHEYSFVARGQSEGIIFICEDNPPLTGEVINKIRVRSNLNHKDINIKWVSHTRK